MKKNNKLNIKNYDIFLSFLLLGLTSFGGPIAHIGYFRDFFVKHKKWLDEKNYNKFSQIFSCENEQDILAEFFFLISNFLAVENDFKKSNFYSNISNYLNPKFYFNLTHLISNYIENKNYEQTKNLLDNFNKEDEIYYYFIYYKHNVCKYFYY